MALIKLKICAVCSIDVTPRISRGITICSPPVSFTKSIKAIYQSFENSIIDVDDEIKNVRSIDVTPLISKGITIFSLSV